VARRTQHKTWCVLPPEIRSDSRTVASAQIIVACIRQGTCGARLNPSRRLQELFEFCQQDLGIAFGNYGVNAGREISAYNFASDYQKYADSRPNQLHGLRYRPVFCHHKMLGPQRAAFARDGVG
jgi:hypothetical protein